MKSILLVLFLMLIASGLQAQGCKPIIPQNKDTAIVTTFFSGNEKIRIPYDFNKDSVKIGTILMRQDSISSVSKHLLRDVSDFSASEFSILYCDKYVASGDTIREEDIVGIETLTKQNDKYYNHRLFARASGVFSEQDFFNCKTPVLINFTAIDLFSAKFVQFRRNPKHHAIIFLFDPEYKIIKKPGRESELSDRIKELR